MDLAYFMDFHTVNKLTKVCPNCACVLYIISLESLILRLGIIFHV